MVFREQSRDTAAVDKFARMTLLENVDVVGIFHKQMIDLDLSFLSVSSGTTNSLSHAGFPVVLGRNEKW